MNMMKLQYHYLWQLTQTYNSQLKARMDHTYIVAEVTNGMDWLVDV